MTSLVHVETIDEGDPEGETAWLRKLDVQMPCKIVCFVDLATADAPAALARQAAAGCVGVRHILNHEPSWPNVREDLLASAAFRANYARLADRGLSFDAQLNPHQMAAFAELAAAHPGVPVMLNHLGCLALAAAGDALVTPEEHRAIKAADDAATATWRAGMAKLAALPHVHVKLSMLPYTLAGWEADAEKEAVVEGLVREVVSLFGPDRCCFASNYPVDKLDGVDAATMYAKFRAFTADLPADAQRALFHDTAARFYKV